MKRCSRLFFLPVLGLMGVFAMVAHPSDGQGASTGVTLTARNPLRVARANETVVLDAARLRQMLGVQDVRRIHVRDSKSGEDLLTQAVNSTGRDVPIEKGGADQLLFQSSFGPEETKQFVLTIGERRVPSVSDFKVYGRFVREREDDFAWENDRIAHRMYGTALETWKQEPLTSSAVDVWAKRVPRLVINNWYMVDDYHRDHGEGGDFYAAGTSRGCGGNGIWIYKADAADGKLYPSANFVNSRVIANGPIRLIFELTYPAWDAAGAKISEVKRITLDAGQNLDHFESHYMIEGTPSGNLADAVGIRKGIAQQMSESRQTGILRGWERLPDGHGELGISVIADPASVIGFAEDRQNHFTIVKLPPDRAVSYYAGFGWSFGSEKPFTSAQQWDEYVRDFAERVRHPLEIKIEAGR